jgi:dolichol-phosphate mannosyltransferase
MSVTFIVPTINEVENINPLIEFVEKIANRLNLDYEILFVDDQSSDGTVGLILDHCKSNSRILLYNIPERRGLGYALWQGMLRASKKFIVFIDCDLSVSEVDLERLILHRDSNSLIVGSRYLKDSRIINAPLIKVAFSRLLNLIVGAISSVPIRDLSHSLRIMPNDISFTPKTFTHPAFFWELTLYMYLQDLNISEIPITFNERRSGITKNHMLRMLRSVFSGFVVILHYRFNRRKT